MGKWPTGLTVWLLALAGAQTAALVTLCRFFVRSGRGQAVDAAALAGNGFGRDQVADLVGTVLDTVSALSLLVAAAIVGFVALVRRRVAVAFGSVLLIVGANLTTQLLKYTIERPRLGVDLEHAAAGNSLPSGHTTIAASAALAFVLVLPKGVRGASAIVGALVSAAVGVATLSAGWHRPSDAIASLLVAGVWAALAGLFIVAAQRRHGDVEYGPANRATAVTLTVGGLALLAAAWLVLSLVEGALATPTAELSHRWQVAAYGGGALAIAGAAGLVVAVTLATAHRVVPRRVPRGWVGGGTSVAPAEGLVGEPLDSR